ncbi:MAG: carboxypeptidase-like regulatory domain-containing protein [Phycisphaerales bacterium]|nr:carboxypeptidase-like regulatory domain-containing protein [Phycisphaerales bacterium]
MIKKRLLLSAVLFSFGLTAPLAQEQPKNQSDSVVQLFGVVMSADSLKSLQGTSIIIEGKGRGTISNEEGVFSIVVLKGEQIRFSSVGYKDKVITIPTTLKDDQYSVIQLMVTDTFYLPATVIHSLPSREEFERDFQNLNVDHDDYYIANRNVSASKRAALLNSLPADGREAVNLQLQQQAQKSYYAGQITPIQLLNPAAWASFIKSWKRGDFKRKKSYSDESANTDDN